MKITLYHGSTLSIEHPLAKVGRADLDFGRGFYLTSLRSQAEQWAARVQLLRASTTAWINVYEFDMDAAIKAGFKLLRFDAYDQHWLNFIVASRNGKQPWKDYDIIEGGVANDRVIDTIEDYLNDIITIEQALGQLLYAQPNHQICLLNQQLIDTLKQYGRPMICTEYMARTQNSTFQNIMPMLKRENIGAINWGLVAGKTNTIFAWDTPLPDVVEPPLWFHDIFRSDGTPYSTEEVECIRSLTK